jgi:hypothetical protein
MRWEWVRCVWPMRVRCMTSSSLLETPMVSLGMSTSGETEWSLLQVSWFHDSCHCDITYLFVKGLKSEWGTLQSVIVEDMASLAAVSAAVLSRMPIWLGIHMKVIEMLDETRWCILIRIFTMLGFDQLRFSTAWIQDIESTRIRKFSLWLVSMILVVMSTARNLAVNIESLSGRRQRDTLPSVTAAAATFSFSLEPSVGRVVFDNFVVSTPKDIWGVFTPFAKIF